MSRSDQLMAWVREHLDSDGLIDRWVLRAKGREFGLRNTNHLFAANPRMIRVGERMARPL